MSRFKSSVSALAFAAAALVAVSSAANAGSVTEPGETVGIGLGNPLPEGFYFVDTASYIQRNNTDAGQHSLLDAAVNIPVLAYSSSIKIAGGRLEAYGAIPEEEATVQASGGNASLRGLYNPALLVGLAWDLGNGFGFSNFIGGYAPVKGQVGVNAWTFNERAALSWSGNGYSANIHAIYGTSTSDQSTHKDVQADYLNVDMSATKSVGKWDLGVAAFGSTDLSSPYGGYKRQDQIAVGPLAGYNFPGVTLQTYLTRDVVSKNYGDGSTVFWFRIVAPL